MTFLFRLGDHRHISSGEYNPIWMAMWLMILCKRLGSIPIKNLDLAWILVRLNNDKYLKVHHADLRTFFNFQTSNPWKHVITVLLPKTYKTCKSHSLRILSAKQLFYRGGPIPSFYKVFNLISSKRRCTILNHCYSFSFWCHYIVCCGCVRNSLREKVLQQIRNFPKELATFCLHPSHYLHNKTEQFSKQCALFITPSQMTHHTIPPHHVTIFSKNNL